MKKRWSKKPAIVALALTNAVTFAVLVGRQTHFLDRIGNIALSSSAASQASGEIRKGIVKAAKASQDNALQSCYESFLARGPQIDEGAVVVHWIIDPDGRITSLKLMRTDLQDDDFTSCVLENVQHMTFKPPSKVHPTLVAHTFNFKRKDNLNLGFQ